MSETERQRVVRVPGARRAKLTPAPGTEIEPDPDRTDDEAPAESVAGASEGTASRGDAEGPNDDRMRREVPPHY